MKEWSNAGFTGEMSACSRKGYSNGVRLFTRVVPAPWVEGRSRS